METVAKVNGVIFTIVVSIAIYLGLDPKKWKTWLLSLYGFLSFFLVGIVGTGNFYVSVKVGAIATFALIFGGITTYWNQKRAWKWLREREAESEEKIKNL